MQLIRASILSVCACGSVVSPQPDASTDTPEKIRVVVVDDFDPDYTTSPFDDRFTILTFDPATNMVVADAPHGGLNTTETVGGSRGIATVSGGSSITLVENAKSTISTFDASGAPAAMPITTDAASFCSVSLANSRIYATTCTTGVRVYDAMTHAEVAGSPSVMTGFDLVVDAQHNVLWSAGTGLWRGDATTLQGTSIASYQYQSVSLDLAADGSVWVAERFGRTGGSDMLHHYSAAGVELVADAKPLTSAPFNVRVHPKTGDIWYAGSSGVGRYDAGGPHMMDSNRSFWSLAIDETSGIVFAAGGHANPNLVVFSSSGTVLATVAGFSMSVKWVAVLR